MQLLYTRKLGYFLSPLQGTTGSLYTCSCLQIRSTSRFQNILVRIYYVIRSGDAIQQRQSAGIQIWALFCTDIGGRGRKSSMKKVHQLDNNVRVGIRVTTPFRGAKCPPIMMRQSNADYERDRDKFLGHNRQFLALISKFSKFHEVWQSNF